MWLPRVLVIVAVGLSGTAWSAACSELPVLFVVQDKSGSMNFDPDGNMATPASPSKWSAAQTVVPALATQFSNRFRFGAMMYPADTAQFNCNPGTLKTPVSDDASAIGNSYSTALAGGGTPTAATLTAAKSYLLGLHLTTPAYVLLITDGLPNCNLGLNVNTCSFTTPTCPNNSCGLGAKDCLDDQGTIAAAASLKASGIRVFVVGFDPSLTTGNNLSVLNSIAAAGGTATAYTATNKAQLAAALNLIALNTATCCRDACTAGANRCGADGSLQACAFDASIGCTTWGSMSCGASKSCVGGACASTCQDACTLGAKRCANQTTEQCARATNGCTTWSAAATCDSALGESCVDGACKAAACTDVCDDGAIRCGPTGPQVCVTITACSAWKDAAGCDARTACDEGVCRPTCGGSNGGCQTGATCMTKDNGGVCVPNSSSGVKDAGAGAGSASRDGGSGALKDIKAGSGCGCHSGGGPSLILLVAMLSVMWVRRVRGATRPA